MTLAELMLGAAERSPGATAVVGPDGTLSYGELSWWAERVAAVLERRGVGPSDRVGVWLAKSARTVAVLQGVLLRGAAYVPIDPASPAPRAAAIAGDCDLAALFATPERLASLGELEAARAVQCGDPGDGPAAWREIENAGPCRHRLVERDPDALAYVLYTSGSTGRPKGVCISHRNALAFVDWAVEELRATAADRFCNHAPFHFDLSVLDLYGALRTGARVVLVPEAAAYAPVRLVRLLRDERITIWYSVPTALHLMLLHGGLPEAELPDLRAVCFAGEVFPLPQLRELRRSLPGARLLNLYGPTETNVCCYCEVHDVHDVPDDWTSSAPIGHACSGNRVWAVRGDGQPAADGEQGELVVQGDTVMLGYWGQAPQDGRPYATGDLVRRRPDGGFHYLGRKDDMLKVHGHRVEPAEVEAALCEHPAVVEAAVVATGIGPERRLCAFVVAAGRTPPTLLDLKRHCAARLPRWMIVGAVVAVAALPRTSNGKVDRRRLAHDASTAE